MAASAVPAICYDFTAVSRFCRSVAVPVALQKHTRTEWVQYDDSKVLNTLYAALFWKTPPGVVEVRQADAAVLEETANQLQQRYLLAWLGKLHQSGPVAATDYLTSMGEIRDGVREDLQGMYREALALNAQITGETAEAIKSLAKIKLGATVGVAALGAVGAIVLTGTAAVIATGTSAGYSMTCSLIKEYERGGKAMAVGVSIEAGKATASEVLGWTAGRTQLNALAREARASQILKSAQGVIHQQSTRIARLAAEKGSKRVARQAAKGQQVLGVAQRQAAAQQATAQSARTVGSVAKVAKVGVPVVFAAWDILDGIADYNETIRAL